MGWGRSQDGVHAPCLSKLSREKSLPRPPVVGNALSLRPRKVSSGRVVVLLVLVETCWRLAPLCARHPSRLPGPAGQVLLRPSQFGSA